METVGEKIKDIKDIAIAIDTWDDIFSDFDPRPLGERVLSEDFVSELRKRYKEKRSGRFRITILAPRTLKDDKSEKTVIQRLKGDFHQKFSQKSKEIKRIRARGVLFVFLGILSLSILTIITYFKVFSPLWTDLLGIILMPLGWFGIWEGFSKLVDTSPKVLQEEILFKKLSKAEYRFVYENTQ